jgi:hypothetical protein
MKDLSLRHAAPVWQANHELRALNADAVKPILVELSLFGRTKDLDNIEKSFPASDQHPMKLAPERTYSRACRDGTGIGGELEDE